MYNLTNKVQQAHGHQITHQQLQHVKEVQQYLTANHVHEIMNEALAKLIENRPQKVKQGLIAILKSIKEKQTYFKKIDFEHMFQSYDFFSSQGGNQIPYQYLMQALQKINISYSKQEFLQKYPQFKLDRTVKKLDFVNIMEAQYRKKIKL